MTKQQMIEANAKLMNAGFSRICDDLYVKPGVEFRLTADTINNLPL